MRGGTGYRTEPPEYSSLATRAGRRLAQEAAQWRRNPRFTIRYRTRDENDFETPFRTGRLEIFDQGLYLNVSDVPKRGYVEVEGVISEEQQFTSDWVTADIAVQVRIS